MTDDWYVHFVTGVTVDAVNYHTHGVWENYRHLDLQITLFIRPHPAHHMLNLIVSRIKKGDVFEEGKKYSGILEGVDVQFKKYTEDGRDVLRLLIPDDQGFLPDKTDSQLHKNQLINYNFNA